MKKLNFLVILGVFASLFLSCSQEILFRDPAVQGTKDSSEFWLSTDTRVYVGVENNLTFYFIEAIKDKDTLILRTNGINPATYTFGNTNSRTVRFTNSEGIAYTTAANRGKGSVIITKFDTITNTLTGTFQFEAIKVNTSDTVHKNIITFQKGILHNVPFYE